MTLPTRVELSKGQRAVLELLRDRPMTTADFLRSGVGSRFGARIGELRDKGFGIDTLPLKNGARYTLEVDVERAARSRSGRTFEGDRAGADQGGAPAPGSGDASGCSLDAHSRDSLAAGADPTGGGGGVVAQSQPPASPSLFDDTDPGGRRRLPFMDIDEEEAA